MSKDILEFSERRKFLRGIGGSEAAAALGVGKYTTQHGLWEQVMARMEGDPHERTMTDPMLRGLLLEEPAAKLFEMDTGLVVRNQPIKVDPNRPWRICHVDREILGGDVKALLSIKVPGPEVFYKAKTEGIPRDWNIQGQHELSLWPTKESITFFVWEPARMQRLMFEVPRNDEFISSTLIPGEELFWKMVESGTPPPLDDDEEKQLAHYEEIKGEMTFLDDEESVRLGDVLATAHKAKRAWKKVYEEAKKQFTKHVLLDDGGFPVEIPGVVRAHRSMVAGRVTLKKPELTKYLALMDKDIEDFEKRGKDYPQFQCYPLDRGEI